MDGIIHRLDTDSKAETCCSLLNQHSLGMVSSFWWKKEIIPGAKKRISTLGLKHGVRRVHNSQCAGALCNTC